MPSLLILLAGLLLILVGVVVTTIYFRSMFIGTMWSIKNEDGQNLILELSKSPEFIHTRAKMVLMKVSRK